MMRLRIRLPETEIETAERPKECANEGCDGCYFSFEAIDTAAARSQLMEAVLEYLGQ